MTQFLADRSYFLLYLMLELPFMNSQVNKFEDKKRLNIDFIDFVQVANV